MRLRRFVSRNRPSFGAATGLKRSGAVAVEFAVGAPFLCFLALGMFELARGINVKCILTDAARKACRTGVQPGKTNAEITAEINNILSDNQIAPSNVAITVQVNGSTADASTAKRNDRLSVKVAIPVSKFYWINTFFLSAATIESETVVMMRQA